MYASVVTSQFRPEKADELVRIAQEQIPPLVQQFLGHQGILALLDRSTGQMMGINRYATAADARQVETSGQYQQAMAPLRDLLIGQASREVYEVVLHDQQGQARYARVTQGQMPPGQLDEQSGGPRMAEAARQEPGYAGFLLLAERTSGRVLGLSLWDSQEAMEASDRGYYQREMTQAASQFVGQPTRTIYEVGAQS